MLTDAKIKAAKPAGDRYALADGKVEGLELRVGKTGKKSWSLVYRHEGQRRRVAIGKGYPTTGLNDARKLAREAWRDVARGVDPAAEKQADKEALRMVDLLGETDPTDSKKDTKAGWYLESYVKTAGKLGPSKTEKGIATDRARIRKNLRKRKNFMRKRVDEVTLADLNRIKADLTPGTWRHVRDILRVCLAHAEEIGAIAKNPAARLKATQSRKVERYLSPDERKRLDSVLEKLEAKGPNTKDVPRGDPGGLSKHMVRAIRLLSLTGMRRGEVLSLRWEWIDWQHGQLRLPTSKTGAKAVPLTPQALDFLKAERGSTIRVGLVCPTDEGTEIHPDNLGRAWRKSRKVAKLDDVRIHDLRHSWASDAVSAGVPLHVVGKVLGHKSTQTTARYAHLHDKAIREGLEVAGRAIELATKGGK